MWTIQFTKFQRKQQRRMKKKIVIVFHCSVLMDLIFVHTYNALWSITHPHAHTYRATPVSVPSTKLRQHMCDMCVRMWERKEEEEEGALVQSKKCPKENLLTATDMQNRVYQNVCSSRNERQMVQSIRLESFAIAPLNLVFGPCQRAFLEISKGPASESVLWWRKKLERKFSKMMCNE